jgi:dihydrofolate synthase / folylpolyglutamate synthase
VSTGRVEPRVSWSSADAERYLLGLELFGMRFGLDRMRRLMTALDLPQERFRSIHVVGTNGKSSTTRMTAAILERHGVRAGAYVSPHLTSFAERIVVAGRELASDDFARAVGRARDAATLVDRTLGDDDRVTQFEVLTAAAYWELARQGVDVAVVEAGLGGRYDATNVIPSEVTVLTNVGLEHTRWLGPTVAHIAREKLAVLRPATKLVVGPGLDAVAEQEASRAAARQGAQVVVAPADVGVELVARGDFQRTNFALATTAAAALIGDLDEPAVREAGATTVVPGRFEVVAEGPTTIVDGAHNAGGCVALAASLPAFAQGRPVVAVVSILDDKDAAAMLAALLPQCAAVVYCACTNPRALPPATLESLHGQVGGPPAYVEPDPWRALERARALAPNGVVLATGSIYLVADLRRPAGATGVSAL